MLLYVEEELLTNMEYIIASQKNLQFAERMMHLIEVPNMNRTSWIKERMLNLYTTTYLTGNGPNPEPSNSCNFCPYKHKCIDETGVIIPNMT
jgi:hypothetical protein